MMAEAKFHHFLYLRSGKKGIYDKIKSLDNNPFDFLKFEPPRDSRLINAGVQFVVMSFKNRKKTLHTGIIPIDRNVFIGNNLKKNGKKDFLLIYYDESKTLHLFLFPNRNPKNKSKFGLDMMRFFLQTDII